MKSKAYYPKPARRVEIPILLTSGYIKPTKIIPDENGLFDGKYRLKLTNQEVKIMFQKMVSNWFKSSGSGYNDFIKAMLSRDTKAMNYYMNQVALSTFSFLIQGKSRQHLHRNVSITALFWDFLLK